MDGIRFLGEVHDRWPDITRVMLTGQADLDASIAAVNLGRVYRFLTKPCDPDTLGVTLDDGIEHYRLIRAEKELLEGTLQGTISMATDVMGMVDPEGHAHSSRIRDTVVGTVRALGLPTTWEFEVAARLSQIGTITLPGPTVEKLRSGAILSEEDQRMIRRHPEAAFNLIERIPRLERAAAMIRGHLEPSDSAPGDLSLGTDADVIALGSLMLNLAVEYDRHIQRGASPGIAFGQLRQRTAPPVIRQVLDAMESLHSVDEVWAIEEHNLNTLMSGMITARDIRSETGSMLMPEGRSMTAPMIERLRVFAAGDGVVQPIAVKVARRDRGTVVA
jgi:response regulator RpfG family c-di-GMP phosphodiesterase